MSAVFASGASSSEERPRFDLIPLCALEREATRMGQGAAVHGERNYQKGADDDDFARDRLNHLIAHALNYASGDRSEDHLAAIRCNAGILMWLERAVARPGIHFEPVLDVLIEGNIIVTSPEREPERVVVHADGSWNYAQAMAADFPEIPLARGGGFGHVVGEHQKMGPPR